MTPLAYAVLIKPHHGQRIVCKVPRNWFKGGIKALQRKVVRAMRSGRVLLFPGSNGATVFVGFTCHMTVRVLDWDEFEKVMPRRHL